MSMCVLAFLPGGVGFADLSGFAGLNIADYKLARSLPVIAEKVTPTGGCANVVKFVSWGADTFRSFAG